jgi:carbon starvation protein
MSAIWLAVIGLSAFVIGYIFYSRFVAERIYRLDPNFRTPAHELKDGVDFVPTNRFVLWGHHFASVAGAAPIVGPAIAVIWGWLPAFLWVVFGTIFFAGVHDFGALWASSRNRAKSVGALTEDIVGKRARTLFMIVIFLLLLMVNAVFAIVISRLFIGTPSSVFPVWAVMPVAALFGYLIYKRNMKLLIPSVVGVTFLYASIFMGSSMPFELPSSFFGLGAGGGWVLILFAYAAVASLLPVWLLLQPRDYINGLQLFVGLIIMYAAVVVASPTIVAPAINANLPAGTPPIFPLLFVTIACGAISGFHGLVASGTTSKQLDKETDARFVGYLGSTGEGVLALLAIIACTAGFSSLAEWEGYYTSFTAGSVNSFVLGGARILEQGLGLSISFGTTLLAVMAILFAATTMDTGVRLQRYIIQEWGNIYNIPALTGRYTATVVAVLSCLVLAFAAGPSGAGGLEIWPLFGTTNQLLAGLTLLVISVYLLKLRRPTIFTLVPLTFLLTATLAALLVQLAGFFRSGKYLLAALDVVILAASIWVALEALGAFARVKAELANKAAPAEG